ncbi:MAG: radical SAM protein, partial [Staphylothermus sp.]|nr:radical SAM protein [Staphylothermus sp.]
MVLAFIPSKKFPAISITGTKCWLMCSYCMGRYLKGMNHVHSPDELMKTAEYYAERGAIGLLISGGFTREGKLPLKPYIKTIKEIKKKYDLVISIHTGLIDKEEAFMLREAGVDIIDYEFIL